ncbi:hypothetical protein GCM10027186_53140 [Micromonospora schwarzwaldensis]
MALAGTWNVLPVALLSLAAAVLAVGHAPQGVVAWGVVPTVGGFLLTVVADSVDAPGWVGGLSPYTHLAAVPSAVPAWPAMAAMIRDSGPCRGDRPAPIPATRSTAVARARAGLGGGRPRGAGDRVVRACGS